ncbi:glycoside hydrolase family 30 protein [Paxillus involutus ATCC 200175]|nr:glycoside hydrolase family 30 protein [Paxillus involutus ATCC 200175]
MLFTYFQPTPDPINFVSPGAIGSADIVVDDSSVYQTILGFGASLTDSSAQLFHNLKSQNSNNYWELLDYLFNITDAADSAGFSYIRVPLGASDFSANTYSYDDTSGDVNLNAFNIGAAPSYVFSTLSDILSINQGLRVHVVPWSPPGWMKSGTMDGGSLNTAYISVMANYLLKSLQGFQSKGIPIYAISIQNEPENSNPTYPTCSMPVSTEAQIGLKLRTLMNSNGFQNTKIIGYEHNWVDAANYPVQLMQQAGSAFDGVSFHCYQGSVSEQAEFTSQYPNKVWWMPSDYDFVDAPSSWALQVGAYVTGRVLSTDWERYSIVVLNWDDSASTTWNPQPVEATIEFRGMQASIPEATHLLLLDLVMFQATYTFPVGVTTLWWYAPAN